MSLATEQNYRWLLSTICDCGYLDLQLLDDCEYDICEIAEECHDVFGNYNINNMVRIVFEKGINDINCEIGSRIEDLYEDWKLLTDEEKEELAALEELDPFDDIHSFHNYIDTHIWIAENSDIYHKYMQRALEQFTEMTGFDFE